MLGFRLALTRASLSLRQPSVRVREHLGDRWSRFSTRSSIFTGPWRSSVRSSCKGAEIRTASLTNFRLVSRRSFSDVSANVLRPLSLLEAKKTTRILLGSTGFALVLGFFCGSATAEDSVLEAKLAAIFSRFASVEKDGERFMTPEDFIRSLLPDGTKEIPSPDDPDAPWYIQNSQLTVLFKVVGADQSGLIGLADYKLLFHLLTTPQSEFRVAFHLFDRNKSGYVSKSEFKEVMKYYKLSTGFDFDDDCELMKRFFGRDGKGQLSYAQFSQFLQCLEDEISRQEFRRYDTDNDGFITGEDFGELLLSYMETNRIPNRIRSNISTLKENLRHGRVSYAEFDAFNKFLRQLDVVANGMLAAAEESGGHIRKEDLTAAIRVQTGITLSPLEVDIIFAAFDADSDGKLVPSEYDEFLELVADRKQRGRTVRQWLESGQEKADDIEQIIHPVPTSIWKAIFAGIKSFILGGIAGAIGATVVYPIDLVKTRMQNQRRGRVAPGGVHYENSIDCFRKVLRNEGFAGLYRGIGPQLVGVAPEKAIKLVVNDYLRKLFSRPDSKEMYMPLEILAGGSAGGAQVLFTNPLEIIKIRLQVQGQVALHTGAAPKSAVQIIRELGFSGLYKGAGACLLRDIPFSGIYFPLYAKMKKVFGGDHPTGGQLLAAGSFSGVFAASLTTPADVIKTRLQVEQSGDVTYNGIRDTAVKIWRMEGWQAFWKGAGARVLRSSPQFGVTLLAYEVLQAFFATNPDQARPFGVVGGGISVSEEDRQIMRQLVLGNMKRLSRFGLHGTEEEGPERDRALSTSSPSSGNP